MKKKLSIALIISSVALSLGAAAGINNIVKSKELIKVDAASVTGSFVRQNAYYQGYTSDPTVQSITRSDMATAASWSSLTFSNNGNTLNLTLAENAASGDWHAMYVPFSYTVTLPAYSKISLSFPCNISTYKDSSSGEADHVAEVHFYDVHSYTDLVFLNLFVDKDNPSSASVLNTGFQENQGVYRVTRRTQGTENGSKTFTKELTNYSASTISKTVYFGFFGYIEQSKYNHQWHASLSINATATTTEYEASVGTNSLDMVYFETFTSAFNYASGNSGTIQLYKDVSIAAGCYVQSDVTLQLNGHTLDRPEASTSIFGVAGGASLTINGGGGTIKANGNACVIYTNAGSTLTARNVTIQNTQSGSGRHVIQLNSGSGSNVSLSNNVTLKCSGGGSGIYTSAGGNTIKCYNATINSGTAPAIVLNGSSTSKNTLFIGASCVFNSYVQINNNAYNTINTYCDGVSYQGSQTIQLQYGTLPNPNDVILNMLSNASGTEAYTKFAVKNAPSYMTIVRSNTDTTKALYGYVEYSVTINASNVEYTNVIYKATHANNFMITFRGTSNGYYALPSTITVKIGGVTKTVDTDYSWNQSTGVVTIFADKIIGNITITISGVVTNKKTVADFVASYMHMNDYTEDLGYCSDSTHHYYASAKQALINLGSECINEFRTNSAFASALARYEAWAAANQDNNPFAETQGSKVINQTNNSNIILVVIVCSTILISFLAMGFIFYKKKKHQ